MVSVKITIMALIYQIFQDNDVSMKKGEKEGENHRFSTIVFPYYFCLLKFYHAT